VTVVDNSVVVDLLLGRVDVLDLGDEPVAAPYLLDTELLDAVRGLTLGRIVTEAQAAVMLERFGELSIDRHSAEPLRDRVWQLRHNLTSYDATYVALAEHLDSRLVTRDARMARAPGIRCHVDVL
jgi:predicted nucleic acid-binding protein